MKALYKPFGIILGLLAGIAGRQVASQVWGMIDEEEPPKPTTRQTTWGKLLAATAVQGVVFSIIKMLVTRGGAKGYAHLTGVWPGDERPERE